SPEACPGARRTARRGQAAREPEQRGRAPGCLPEADPVRLLPLLGPDLPPPGTSMPRLAGPDQAEDPRFRPRLEPQDPGPSGLGPGAARRGERPPRRWYARAARWGAGRAPGEVPGGGAPARRLPRLRGRPAAPPARGRADARGAGRGGRP